MAGFKFTPKVGGGSQFTPAKPSGFQFTPDAHLAAKKTGGHGAWWQKVLASGPISTALDVASRPSYAIGDLIAGKGLAAANEIIQGLPGKRAKISPGQALAAKGLMPGGKLGSVAKFAADVGLDPTTYLTFGASSVARTAAVDAAKAASTHFAERVAADALKGVRAPLADVAHHAIGQSAARATVPKALTIGVRVPFTRGKVIPLGESQAAHRVLGAPGRALKNTTFGTAVREGLVTHGAGNKVVHETYAATRRAGEAEKRQIGNQAKALEDQIFSAEKRMGWSRGQAATLITRHLDNPDAYKLPKSLTGLAAQATKLLDGWHTAEVGAGIDKNVVENYVTHLAATPKDRVKYQQLMRSANPGQPFFTKERSLPNLDAWAAAGLKPETNIARLLEVRGHASVDARVQHGFDNAVAEHFGKTGDLTGAHQYWQDFPANHLAGTTVPPDIAESVRRVHEQITPNVSDTGLESTKRFIQRTTSSWKSLALLSPGYHLRNLQSDLMAAYWAGARNPLSFIQAGKALRGHGSVVLHGKTLTSDQLVAVAEHFGVIRTGQAGKEIKQGVAQFESGRPTVAIPGHGRVATLSRNIGQGREDMTRLGLFIERLKAGDTFDEAAKATHDFLFDYGDVSRFVKSARQFWLPFLTYPAKAVPMVAKTFAKRPGIPATLGKLQQQTNLAAGVDPSLLPVGQRASFALPGIPDSVKKAIGAPSGQPLLYNPESVLPYGTLNQLNPKEIQKYVLGGMLSPFVRAPVELTTGHSFYAGRQFAKRVKAPAAISAAHAAGLPVAGFGPKQDFYTKKMVAGYSPKLDTILRTFPAFSQTAGVIPGGGTESSRLSRVRYLSGLALSPYDKAKALYYAQQFGGK